MKLELPYPPSANRYWRYAQGRIYHSEEAKLYKARLALHPALRGAKPFRGAVRVELDFYRPLQSGDLDNRIKQVLDGLQGKAYINDAQIVEINARRHEDKANPRVVVCVEEVE